MSRDPHRCCSPTCLAITSDPHRMVEVREAVKAFAEQVGFAEPVLTQIALAVDEALANVIRHGYGGSPGQPIDVALAELKQGEVRGIEVVICDIARQVDPATIAGRDLDDIRPGGLGTHIIRSVMDEVSYSQRDCAGMRLRMVKWLKPSSSPA